MQKTHTPIISRLKVPLVVALLVGVVFAVPASRQATLELFSFGEPEMEAGVYYTCPMHPDIRLSQAGDCPICGMSLVKKEAGEDGESSGSVLVTTQQVQLTGITVEHWWR